MSCSKSFDITTLRSHVHAPNRNDSSAPEVERVVPKPSIICKPHLKSLLSAHNHLQTTANDLSKVCTVHRLVGIGQTREIDKYRNALVGCRVKLHSAAADRDQPSPSKPGSGFPSPTHCLCEAKVTKAGGLLLLKPLSAFHRRCHTTVRMKRPGGLLQTLPSSPLSLRFSLAFLLFFQLPLLWCRQPSPPEVNQSFLDGPPMAGMHILVGGKFDLFSSKVRLT